VKNENIDKTFLVKEILLVLLVINSTSARSKNQILFKRSKADYRIKLCNKMYWSRKDKKLYDLLKKGIHMHTYVDN
jgi:hypothetical protein